MPNNLPKPPADFPGRCLFELPRAIAATLWLAFKIKLRGGSISGHAS